MADVDEKTQKARAERREKLLAWYEEKELPPVIGDYELRIIDEQHDRNYYAFGCFTSRMDGRSASHMMRKRRITW